MLKVNGENLDYRPGGMTVQDVLDARNYVFRMLVVKVNDEFVPREQYSTFRVPDGADVQVIHLISGG